MKKKIIITLLVLLLLTGGGAAAVILYHKHARSSNPAAVYPLDYFVGNWYENSTTLSGFVQASEEQKIYAGTNQVISEVLVQIGDEVHIGDPLLVYDNEKLELHINTLKAELEVTEASLTMAKNELKRLRRITPIPDNATPQKTAAEIALEEAQAKLSEAEANLESAQFSPEAEKLNELNAEFSELVEQLMELEKPVPDPNILPDPDKKDEEDEEETETPEEEDPGETETPEEEDPGESETSEDDPFREQLQEYEEQLAEYEEMRDGIINELKEKRQEKNEAEEAYQALNDRLYAAWEKANEDCEKAREAYEKEQQGKGEEETYTRSRLAAAIAAKEQEIKDGELSVKRQKLDIRLEELKLKDGTVTAVRDGVVTRLDISDENIGAGEPILTISGENSFTASIDVDEWSYSHIDLGTEVSVLSYDTGMTYIGVVTEKGLSPSEDNYYFKGSSGSVSYYPITVAIRDGEGLYSGAWVEASIGNSFSEEERMSQLVLPTFLVKQEGGKYYVMKDEGGKLVKTYISTGKIYNGEMIVVKSGITASDRIAFPYLKNAVEGQATKPAEIDELYTELYK